VSSKISLAGELGSEPAHPVDQAVEGKGHRFQRFDEQIESASKRLQGALGPPAEMVRRRIQDEIWDLGQSRGTMWHDNAEMSRRFHALYQTAGEIQRIRDVLDDMKGADDIVFFRMRGSMLGGGLAPDIGLGPRSMRIGVEADINRVGQIRGQRSLAATNIEDLVTPSNQFGNAPEFGPRAPGSAQDVVKVPTPMKIEVKDFIAG
jgi:hypothetical protein